MSQRPSVDHEKRNNSSEESTDIKDLSAAYVALLPFAVGGMTAVTYLKPDTLLGDFYRWMLIGPKIQEFMQFAHEITKLQINEITAILVYIIAGTIGGVLVGASSPNKEGE